MSRRKVLVTLVFLILVVVAGRLVWGPIRMLAPVGACLPTGQGINLDNPLPYRRAAFSGTVVGLAASGGGSRAAYFDAAVLREIRRAGSALWIGTTPPGASLLEQLDIVSSVSGGSLAAGYFTLNSPALTKAPHDGVAWREFLDKMAVPYRTRQWYGQAAWNPVVWGRSLFTDYNRGVLARDDYDSVLFNGATLHDLPDRPALYINAFDVANHVRFVLSKHYIDATYPLQRGSANKLNEPRTLFTANDLTWTKVVPASVRVADAVYASTAFPGAYPNLPMPHCGQKILFQGTQVFLADGALADNSGLITLMTQLRAGFNTRSKGSTIVAVYLDASVDRIDNNGTRFQQTGVEADYAWRDTVVGHAVESILGGVALLQDLGWRLVSGMDVVTDQLSLNWRMELTRRAGTCKPASETRSSWSNPFEAGALALKPLVIRLGLRDVVAPEFVSRYGRGLSDRPELVELLEVNGVADGIAAVSKNLSARLQAVPTDFTLHTADRRLLDLAAFLLVHGKLAGDVALWNDIHHQAPSPANLPERCPL